MNCLRNILICVGSTLLLSIGRGNALTVLWSDNFESNAVTRWSVAGAWKIAAPTAGPSPNASGFRTHLGANCASTQNYASNQDSRLFCTRYNGTNSLLIPSADQFPRLRFWHWFKFANAFGCVEISTNHGSSWTQISPTYLNINGGGIWSRATIDLSAYAGRRALIAFHFISGGCCGNSLGWFVDDVEVVTGVPILTFPESFESDFKSSSWSADSGTWEIGPPTSGPNAAHRGTNCAATVLGGNYANNADSRLVSPPFLVPSSGKATLSFWQWYSFNNALGFVEVNNGNTSTTAITNITITTNTVAVLDTNIYQFSGAAGVYTNPFYWNSTIGGWTNATKVLANILDVGRQYQYYFEAGNAPRANIGGLNVDYLALSVLPVPRTAAATNYLAWQGMTWSPGSANNQLVGFFGTNYLYTYTTNTTVIYNQSSWTQISPTYLNTKSGGWINTTLDLSAFAGQNVQLGFHFTSGGIYAAPGWYVDDITLAAAPVLNVPTNRIVIHFGEQFTNWLSATNSLAPGSIFTFALAAASTNVVVKSNGLVTWMNTNAPPGTYAVYVRVTDNNSPPFSATNNFSVTVLPLPSQLILTNLAVRTNGGRKFTFTIKTPWTNTSWRIQAATNLGTAATNWLPLFTNAVGAGGSLQFTDALATNSLQRFYRVVYP